MIIMEQVVVFVNMVPSIDSDAIAVVHYYGNRNIHIQAGDLVRDHAKGGALTEVTFFILLSLYTPSHGYAIKEFVKEKTLGRLSLGAGTLYGALSSLEEKGLIQPCDHDRRKKAYKITRLGKSVAERELERLKALAQAASEIIGPAVTG